MILFITLFLLFLITTSFKINKDKGLLKLPVPRRKLKQNRKIDIASKFIDKLIRKDLNLIACNKTFTLRNVNVALLFLL